MKRLSREKRVSGQLITIATHYQIEWHSNTILTPLWLYTCLILIQALAERLEMSQVYGDKHFVHFTQISRSLLSSCASLKAEEQETLVSGFYIQL